MRLPFLAITSLGLIILSGAVLPPLPESWDADYGLKIWYLAMSAFCNHTQLTTWTCPWCYKNPDFICDAVISNASTGTYGFVAHSVEARTAVVSFRGSDKWPNYWLDIDPFKVRPYPDVHNATVHDGFYVGYKALENQIYNVLDALFATPQSPLYVVCTGHSLGAALAGVAAVDLTLRYGHLINMGSPRIGNAAFAKYFASLNITSWRCVHYHDIVPHLPFRYLPPEFGYHHVGTEIWEYNATQPNLWKVCDSSGEDPSCADSVPFWEWYPPDHEIYFGVANDNCGNQ